MKQSPLSRVRSDSSGGGAGGGGGLGTYTLSGPSYGTGRVVPRRR